VAELQKASDATSHENGLLRAQVQRLQTELREYRKRLSLNASVNRSTLPSTGFSFSGSNGNTNNGTSNNFQFEFPRFGGLPGTHMLNKNTSSPGFNASNGTNANNAPGVLARNNSAGRSASPRSRTDSPASVAQKSPSITNDHPAASSFDVGTSNNGINSGPQSKRRNTDTSSRQHLNSVSSSSNTDSPSASSVSQYGGPSSSCGTSPEPSHSSPTNNADDLKDTIKDGYICHGNSEGEITFCEKLNMACGNPRNPIPRAMSVSSNGKPATLKPTSTPVSTAAAAAAAASAKSPASRANGFDFLAENGGQFNPELFGDYRESQTAIVGEGDFTGGFFDDAFNFNNYGSPNFHFGDTPAVSTANKPNPLEQIEKIQDGDDDEVVPGEDTTQMLNCHKIW
jgi:AP-1-like transcription factor